MLVVLLLSNGDGQQASIKVGIVVHWSIRVHTCAMSLRSPSVEVLEVLKIEVGWLTDKIVAGR